MTRRGGGNGGDERDEYRRRDHSLLSKALVELNNIFGSEAFPHTEKSK